MALYLFTFKGEALYDKELSRTTFLHHINDLQRGIYDAKQAASLFTEMCRGLKTLSGLPFDCSADDSACHIRANMIQHYLHYYSENTQLLNKIDFYMEQLSTLQYRIPDIQEAVSTNLKVPVKLVTCPILSQKRHTIGSFQEGFKLFIRLHQNEIDNMTRSTWDPNNILTTIKFISYTFILHKYMKLSIDKAVVRDVLDLELLSGGRVRREFIEMKRCITMLSMSYLIYISSSIMPAYNFKSLLLNVSIEVRGKICCPIFLSFLSLMFNWKAVHTNILLHGRRFCLHGYHDNFWLIRSRKHNSLDRNSNIKLNYHWEVNLVKNNVSIYQKYSPAIIIAANSLNGSLEDYINLIRQPKIHRHDDISCTENLEFIESIQKHDFQDIVLHYAAKHKQHVVSSIKSDRWTETLKAISPEIWRIYQRYNQNSSNSLIIQHVFCDDILEYIKRISIINVAETF
ncbi:hypothetical protein F8M41_001443 [Gigaspora margarita]|uniref:Uncharacterized protein n=1 Tax=Gigaspora margarita TaxID=4874 RepID=A0A8H4AZ52_GIGMA|nr:hypothetical protein F8M41_001443 [Gigaspora margarita]